MDSAVEKSSAEALVRLSGRMTFGDQRAFRDILRELQEAEAPKWVFDLSEVVFVDSSAIGMFVVAKDVAAKGNKSVVLRKPRNDVLELMKLQKLHRMMAIEE